MKPSLAVIGLGPMGSAIARTLADRGHAVTVWNRSPERATDLGDTVDVASSPQAAVHAADTTIVSLLDNSVALDVLTSVQPSGAGVVVNLSSDTPSAASRVAELFGGPDSQYLSGVMLTPSTLVGAAPSTMMVAGSSEAFATVKPVLEIVAPDLTHVGDDLAVPAAFDLALLDAFWTTFTGWTHALALGRAHGLKVADLTPRLGAMVRLAADVGVGISDGVESGQHPGEVSNVASALTTLRHIIHASGEAGVSPAPADAILRILEDLDRRGLSSSAPSSMIDVFES